MPFLKLLTIVLVKLNLLWQKILAHQTHVGPILNLQEPMETDVIVLVYLEWLEVLQTADQNVL